jgi:predicted aspartyl protease
MGKVMEKIKVWNIFDPQKYLETEALVDTGATLLALPANFIKRLSLRKMRAVPVRYANNQIESRDLYTAVTLEILGRSATFDVLELPEGSQSLIGQIPLEALDLVVNPKSGKLSPNPLSPDAPMMDLI